ncbi:MAG: hypothetical protein JO287_04355 [Pseudonocardiales bacterium]|nr:hypothetical protein [Pseudonocardiales bacterium]
MRSFPMLALTPYARATWAAVVDTGHTRILGVGDAMHAFAEFAKAVYAYSSSGVAFAEDSCRRRWRRGSWPSTRRAGR